MKTFTMFLEENIYKFHALWDVGSLPSYIKKGKKYLPLFNKPIPGEPARTIVLAKKDITPENLGEVDSKLVLLLNFLGMTKEMQELIIQKNPHLIREIDNLDPDLRRRYKAELNLAEIDI